MDTEFTDELIKILLQPSIQGLLGATFTMMAKWLFVDWFTKGYFARQRRSLRSYEAILDSVSECSMRYYYLVHTNFINFWYGREPTRPEQRQHYYNLRDGILEERIKIHHNVNRLDDKRLTEKLTAWEKNIQARLERRRKELNEEPTSEEDDLALQQHPDTEVFGYLREKLRRMARYDY
ncbi:MAG: hypothetical protein HY914_14530 [Desulfomonile tiedjei]|nr:hypothetical protein [Desulfomonile tiedjei]